MNNQHTVDPTQVINSLLEQSKNQSLEIAKRDALINELQEKVKTLTETNKNLLKETRGDEDGTD